MTEKDIRPILLCFSPSRLLSDVKAMTEKDIRPIPKNILKRIRKLDGKYYPGPDGHVRCYAYLTTWKNELVKVTVAVKHRYKKWYCKQVAIHS